MDRPPSTTPTFGNTFSSSRNSGHREIADDVYQIQECIVKPSRDDVSSDEMLEWYDPREELHAAQNAYLVTGDETLLFDTLTPMGRSTILDNLRAILDGDDLDYLVISHPEANHAGNVGSILAEYPEATLVVAKYGVHHELFDVGEDALLVGDGDTLDLGGGREVAFHAPAFYDHAMTTYMSETSTDTVFTADWFGCEHMGCDCLSFADEQTVLVECDYDVVPEQFNRFQGYAFTWFRYADTAKTDALVDQFAAEYDPTMIAPAHGFPIRRDVDRHLELMKQVIRDISEDRSDYHTHTHGQLLLNRGSPSTVQ